MLAAMLPIKEARLLRERLINYAADTKDHSVSDAFVQILRSRSTGGEPEILRSTGR